MWLSGNDQRLSQVAANVDVAESESESETREQVPGLHVHPRCPIHTESVLDALPR